MIYKFTKRAEKALEIAKDIAVSLGHAYIGTEHLMYGLSKEGVGVASKVLISQNITPQKIINQIEMLVGSGIDELENSNVNFTPRTQNVIESAYIEAKNLETGDIGTEHLLIGIMKEGDSVAVRILMNLKVVPQKLYGEISKVTNEQMNTNQGNDILEENSNGSSKQTVTLNQYGTDITKKASEGKLDPVICRTEEIERVIQILSRRTKNNSCIIGEPGVGKTAIVEGLAQRIAIDDVPIILKNKRIVSLDISSMVAGAKYRGDFEDRIKKCLNEVKKYKDIILFIDEIHTIVGAGSAEGSVDAANILKPLLARGDVQVIGSTTLNEYRKYIEKDSALERRFSPVIVEEPSVSDTILMIKGLKEKYENHHKVSISDVAIVSAVELSKRYINDRFLPDKAIDLIDEAASKVKMKIFVLPKSLTGLEEKISEIKLKKQEAITLQNFEMAANYRDEEKIIEEKLEKEKKKWETKSSKNIINLNVEDIAEVISSFTKIPVNKITEEENEKLKNLENILKENVIGQEEAVKSIAKAIRRGRVGLKDPNKPIGSFIFLGPTGVGKTQLSKILASNIFGNSDSLVRVDMSEYMESQSVSKIIGSPPGYVGYDDGGQLTEKIRKKPYSVILFDEIEKAHPDVMNIMLQLLDDGRLTDSSGRVVNFKDTVIIMTSNVGARIITDKTTLGFKNEIENEEENVKKYEIIKKDVMNNLKKEFKPEFINRIDEIIVFNKLSNDNLKDIIDILLNDLKNRLKQKSIIVDFDENIKNYILEKNVDKEYGARPLKRLIQTNIEDNLAEWILDNKMSMTKKNIVYVDNMEIKIK